MLRLALVLSVCAWLAGTPVGRAQELPGRMALKVPESTREGRWEGTWVYASAERRMALWLREGTGKLPTIRFHLLLNTGGENFLTGWDGHADYTAHGVPAQFDISLDAVDEHGVLRGTWEWDTGPEGTGFREQGEFYLSRSGDGRMLVMQFLELRRTRKGPEAGVISVPQVWTFRKVARRMAEVPELF
jgi:hypothetical protein